MTLCPLALVAGCEKCLLFKTCPLKAIIGSLKKEKRPIAYERTVYGGKYWKAKKKKRGRP